MNTVANIGFGVRIKCAQYQRGVGGLRFVYPVLSARAVPQSHSGAMMKLLRRVRTVRGFHMRLCFFAFLPAQGFPRKCYNLGG